MAWWALKSKAARLGLVESLSAHPGRLSLVNASSSEPELKNRRSTQERSESRGSICLVVSEMDF